MNKIIYLFFLVLMAENANAQQWLPKSVDKKDLGWSMGHEFNFESPSSSDTAYILKLEKELKKELDDYLIFDKISAIINFYEKRLVYANCVKYGKKALKINSESRDLYSLQRLCFHLYKVGKYYESVQMAKRAISKYRVDGGNPWVTQCYRILGLDYSYLKKYREASLAFSNYYQHSFLGHEMGNEAEWDKPSRETAMALYYQACTFNYVNKFDKAVEYFRQSAQIYLEREGNQSPNYIKCLSEIANSYCAMGNAEKAIEYALKCDGLYREIGIDSLYFSIPIIRSIGHAYLVSGDYDKAVEYYNEALSKYNIISKYTDCRGCVYHEREYRDFTELYEAMDLKLKSDCFNTQTLETDWYLSSDYYTNMINHLRVYCKLDFSDYIYIGNAYRCKGDLDKALEYLQKADDLYASISEETSTLLQYNLAKVYYEKADYAKVYYHIKRDCDKLKENIINDFNYMLYNNRNDRWNVISEDYDMLLESSVAVNTPESRADAYNTLLLSKGILLSTEQQMQDVVAKSNNEKLARTFAMLNEAKDKISSEFGNNNSQISDSLSKLVDNYESELLQYSYLYGDIVRNLKIDVEDVRLNLDSNDVAIEFFFTEHGKFGALVMKRDFKHPELVMLKDSTYEGIMKDGKLNKNSAYHGLGLYNNIWKPLEKYFNKNGNIYFSPSGKLHTLAIEYAPISDSLLISNKYRIHRVSSTRYLALNPSHEMSKRAVIYGGIKYDTDINNMLAQSRGYSHSLSELLVSRQYLPMGGNFSANYLPGTLREANAIDSVLYGKKFTTKLITGSEANEESFKNLSGVNYDILHIATHGYCEKNSSLHGDNALELSGLLFSGCNNASKVSSEIEDGVLSAKEISLLDFRNVDMVVMSACETGLGEISNEGVFGLQRGFKKAGANTIVMSLWPVSDKATMIWMTKFYENLASGMKKQEAFSKAQQELRKQFRHPAFWAAFIMLDGE